MAVQKYSIKVLEQSHVSLPPGSVPTTSLPLTFFDIYWLGLFPMKRLFFYEFPYSTLYFMQTTLPNLKTSLSITLKHFFPLAGHLVCPPSPQMPYILYKEGDHVQFIAKESMKDFSQLIGDHARHVQEFQALFPQLGTPTNTADGIQKMPLLAIQVTVFPNTGISIGVTFNHVAADGKAFSHFMKSWASANVCQGDFSCLKSRPDHSGDLIRDPLGLGLIFRRRNRKNDSIPADKFRETYVFKRSQTDSLKTWVTRKWMEENHQSETLRWSSLVVTCSYMWVCLVKLQQNESHTVSSLDIIHHFILQADCRERLKLPATYFGNCIEPLFAAARQSELLGENGIC